MLRKITIFTITTLVFCSIFFGLNSSFVFAGASQGLAVNCNQEVDYDKGGFKDPCGFDTIFTTINKTVKFFLYYLVTPTFAVLFAYAGFLYLTTEQKGNLDKAKKIMKYSVYGYLIILFSWLIIDTIIKFLGYDGPTFLTK